VIASSSQQDDIKHIRAILTQLADDSIEPRQVCIAARTNDDVDAVANGLKKAGVATLRLERSTPDDPAVPGVRVATMHRIKGLEFGVVIIAAYKGATKYAELFARDEDAGVSDETATAERSLLHVAATRSGQATSIRPDQYPATQSGDE
jgi:superfamily I DNA/RNA helicase